MANGMVSGVVRDIGRLFAHGSNLGLTEGQLLERSIERGDETCLGALVERHGPMVLGVCRHLLRDPNDVDDAFQATFLVLVKRSRDLRRRDQLGGWLYGVAVRVANRARINAAKRPSREGELEGDSVADGSSAEPSSSAESSELRRVLHDEIARLPESYRQALVLCYLEGLTHDEAARCLGWPVGTVKGRLARARDLLRDRLTRRGLATATSAGALALLSASPSKAAVPASLVASTTTTALGISSRAIAVSAGVASASPTAISLMEGAIHTMSLSQIKLAATALTTLGLFATGSAVVTHEYQQSSASSSSTGNPSAAARGAGVGTSVTKASSPLQPGLGGPGAFAGSGFTAKGSLGGEGAAAGGTPIGGPGLASTELGAAPGGRGGSGMLSQTASNATELQTIKLAKDALAELDRLKKTGAVSPSDKDYKVWSRRLLDAQLAANLPAAEAIQAAKDYVARIDQITALGRLQVEKGVKSKSEQREDEFLLLEAVKIAKDLEKTTELGTTFMGMSGPPAIPSASNPFGSRINVQFTSKQVELLRQALSEMEKQHKAGRLTIDRLIDMSARLAQAETSSDTTPEEKAAAIKAYLDRTRNLEKQTADDLKEGRSTTVNLLAAKLAVLDAEAFQQRYQSPLAAATELTGRGMMGGMMGMGALPSQPPAPGGMGMAPGSMPGMGGLSGAPVAASGRGGGIVGAGGGLGAPAGGIPVGGGGGLGGPAVAPAGAMPGGGLAGGASGGGGLGSGAIPIEGGGGFGGGAGPRRPSLASKIPNPADEQRNKLILAKLEQPITLSFKQTPLSEVVSFLKTALVEKDGKTVTIYVDPVSLENAGQSMESPVTMEVEDLPLRTSLRLLLSQLSLQYEVSDGLILIQAMPE